MRAGRFGAVVLAGALLLGGCGIPDNSEVLTRGAGPSAGVPSGGDRPPTVNPREATTDRLQFVKNYLEAAAGDPKTAQDRVRKFLAPGIAPTFKPQEVRVVRLTEERPLINPGNPEVRLKVQQIGVLRSNGVLEPSSSPSDITSYSLRVNELNGSPGLFVTQAPPFMLLSDTALENFYQPRTIYFWNTDHTALVPDVRYMSRTVTREQQPNQILEWLTTGPASSLDGAVERLPDGTEPIGNVPAVKDGKLQINLSGQAFPLDDVPARRRLGTQLMWSLRLNLATTLELRIDHQVQETFSGVEYLGANPAYRYGNTPERFVVYNGQVRRLANSENKDAPVPVVSGDVNRNVRSAALSSVGELIYAALVVNEGNEQGLRIAAAKTGEQATFKRARLPAPIGRPAWAVTPAITGENDGTIGLVPANGRLYSFAADALDPREVQWQGGPTRIASVAVAPDGRRIAVVAGGRLYLSVITSSSSVVQIAPPRQIRTLLRDVTAADWSGEGFLVIAGVRADDRVAIMDITIDGAVQTPRLADLGTSRVTQLAAYPANPVTGTGTSNSVAYVADDVAYNALSGPDRIDVDSLAPPVPSPAPSGVVPTAPFFLN